MSKETKRMQDEVEEYLAKRGMKKKFFANQLGVSPSILSQWFGGMIRFPKWRIEQIQKIISEDAIPRVRTGNVYKDVGVHIYLLCHSDLMKTVRGTRIDVLGNIIDQDLDRNDDYGFKLYLVSAKHFMALEEYYGLELYYEAVDWNSKRG